MPYAGVLPRWSAATSSWPPGVRNISGFNKKVKEANDAGKPILDPVMIQMASNDPTLDQSKIPNLMPLPYIVVVCWMSLPT